MAGVITVNLPVFLIILPLVAAFILPTIGRRQRLQENLLLVVGSLGILGAGYLAYLVMDGGISSVYQMGGWPAPWGIELQVDGLAAFFLLVITFVLFPVFLFSRGNLAEEVGGREKTARFYVLILLLGGALAGMALTNDLFNVYVLVEVATISCVALVSSRNHPLSAEAAFRYLILATFGSALILGGIGFIYIITGHLNMGFAAQELAQVWQYRPHVVWMALIFLLTGFGIKAALFPLHLWLPDAHSIAPTPASAILSGLAVKGYIICLFKFFYRIAGPFLLQELAMDKIMRTAGLLGIVLASLMAIRQDELKRRLAFSTVAQIGYLFLGASLLNTRGLAGTFFYLASHAVIKAALFLSAGTMLAATGKEKVSQLAGIGKKMPVTTAVFTIASLGLVGVPLFSGFVGKWYLLLGALDGGDFLSALVIIGGSVLCAAYLFPVVRLAYFEPAEIEEAEDPGIPQKIALVFLAVLVVLLGVMPGTVLDLAGRAALDLLTP